MNITWDTVVALLSVIGCCVSIIVGGRKIGAKSKEDAVWKALVDHRLEEIAKDVKEFLVTEKANKEAISSLTSRVNDLEGGLKAAWNWIDELKKKL